MSSRKEKKNCKTKYAALKKNFNRWSEDTRTSPYMYTVAHETKQYGNKYILFYFINAVRDSAVKGGPQNKDGTIMYYYYYYYNQRRR